MYLLDTNAIIYYLKAGLSKKAADEMDKIVDEQPLISVITKIELLGFNTPNKEEQYITKTFVEAAIVFELNEAVVIPIYIMNDWFRTKN